MPALVESMFYTSNEANQRFVPWHGLGTPVEEAQSSKFAIELAGLDWKVESKPIFDQNGNRIDGYIANTRDNDSSVLGIVTDKYKIVQNEEAFEFTDSLLDEGITYETAGSLRNGRTIWLLAKMPESKILGDDFENYIVFCNTHDGTGAIKVAMTPTRVVCSNTLNIALANARRSWSTRHMGDIQTKLQEAKLTLGLAKEYIVKLDEEADILANIKISDDKLNDILEAMFPINYNEDSPRKINNMNEIKQNILRCYAAPDIAKFKQTGWGVMNAVSDYMSHNAPTRMTKNYQENNFGRIINGHPLFDEMYKRVISLK